MTLKSLKMSAALAAILAAGTAYAGSNKSEDSANATYTDKAEDLAETTTESDAIPSGDTATSEGMPLTAEAEAPTDSITETGMAEADAAETDVVETDLADADIAEPTTEMTVADMLGMNVLSANDEVIGEIDYVVNSLDGQAAVIGIGGFLGLGEYTVAIDVDEFAMTDDEQLKLSQYTEAQLEAMPQFDETSVESLPDDTLIEAKF